MTKEKTAPADDTVFDIASLETLETAILEINHPGNNRPSGWKWTIAGPGHPVTVEQANRLARKANKEAAAKERAIANGKKWQPEEREPEEVRRENAEFYAERVLGWTQIKLRGEEYKFSRENVIKILLDPKMGTVYSQLVDFLRAENSFLEPSETNS